MDLFLLSISWMSFNIFLALIPVVAGIFFLKTKNYIIKAILTFIWFVFLPNTIYLLTDVFHLIDDWAKTTLFFNVILIPMYIILVITGIITFIFSMYPFEKAIKKTFRIRKIQIGAIILLNTVIAIGVTLGRIERINSWEVVSNAPKVLVSVFAIFSSLQLLLVTVTFAVMINLLYFFVGENKTFSSFYKRFLTK